MNGALGAGNIGHADNLLLADAMIEEDLIAFLHGSQIVARWKLRTPVHAVRPSFNKSDHE
jgi:hypothetical protein